MGIWPKVGIVAAIIVGVAGAGLAVVALTNRPLLVKLSEIVPVSFVDAGGLALDCSLTPQQKDKKLIIAGDSVVLGCVVTNTSKKEYKDLTVQTGIERNKINYTRELTGATGTSQTEPIFSFTNVSVDAKGKTEVSILANTNYSNEAYKLTTKPILKQGESVVVGTKKEAELVIEKSNKSMQQLRTEKIHNQGGGE